MAFAVAASGTVGSISTLRPAEAQPLGFATPGAAPLSILVSCGQASVKLSSAATYNVRWRPSPAARSSAGSTDEAATASMGDGTKRVGRPKKSDATTTTQAVKKQTGGKQVVNGVHSDSDAAGRGSEAPKGAHPLQYEEGPWPASVSVLKDLDHVSSALADQVARICADAVESRGVFTIVLSGGSLVKALRRLAEEPYSSKIEWAKWHVFWADERMVPISHANSNFNSAKDEFLSKVPIPPANLHTIDDWDVTGAAAHGYENLLKELAKKKVVATTSVHRHKYPRFDLVLLGIGPDGHVASLFPHSAQLAETRRWVVPVAKSPKPPPRRITLALPCINAAAHVTFVVFGSSKAEVLQRVFERPALPGALPAQLVRPGDGEVTWLVDEAAASKLALEDYQDPKKFPFLDWSSLKEATGR